MTSPSVACDILDRDKYQRFNDHDFDADTRFQKGWEKISSRYRGDNLKAELLEAKICYYSREYEKVTVNGYNQWLQQMNKQSADKNDDNKITNINDALCDLTTETVKISSKGDQSFDSTVEPTGTINVSFKADNSNEAETNNIMTDNNSPDNNESCKECDSTTKSDSLSFTEIAEMIENGMTLPSVEDLNIEPTNTKPTPSSIGRIKKPWEL